MELRGLEDLPWLLGSAAAGTSAALAQPPSRPRRVPGGPVAGDWELSPVEPCAGATREGGGGACSRRLAAWTAPAQAPFLGPRPWHSLARNRSSFGTSGGAALWAKQTKQMIWWRGRLGRVSGRVYIGRIQERAIRWICPMEIILIRDLSAGVIVNYPNNCSK